MNVTKAEQEALDQIAAAQARGEDPFGDNDPVGTTTDPAASDADGNGGAAQPVDTQAADQDGEPKTAGGEPIDDTGSGDDPLNIKALEEIANGAPQAAGADPLQFNAQVPADYKTARAALLAEKSEAFTKMMDGALSAADYAAIEARVLDGLEDLSAQRIRAETLLEANAQSQAQAQQAAINALIVRARDEVPYATDAKAQRQFNTFLAAAAEDPDNAGKPFAHLVNEAHTMVLALRGKQPQSAAAAPASPRQPAAAAPVTLRGVPAAQTPNTGGSITDQLARLSGPEYQAAFAKLTPAQRASLLDE